MVTPARAHERWYVVDAPAVVVGLGLRHRLTEVVDLDRCRAAGVDVLERRAGGGLVWLDQNMLCGAICIPAGHPRWSLDLTQSYRWLGDHLADSLRGIRVQAERVSVEVARADSARLKTSRDPVSQLLLASCYGALSPHEVVVSGRKLVGLAQVRRRHAALFQFGVLLRDQSALAEFVRVPDEHTRESLRAALRARSVGVGDLVDRRPDLEELVGLLGLSDQLA